MIPLLTIYNRENAVFMIWFNTVRMRCITPKFFFLLIVVLSTFVTSAQQKVFTVNNHDNPLKNLSVFSNKESHPFFVDIDGDGDLDCFSGEYAGAHLAKIYFYRNDGTNKKPQFKQVTGDANALNKVAANSLSIPYFIDIDADGDYDCFVGEGNTGSLAYYKNVGNPTHPLFQKQSAAFNPLSKVKFFASGIANPSFADIDGDGDYDCLIVDEDGNETYFKNTGTLTSPSFMHATGSEDPFTLLVSDKGMYNPSFYDWNHDGSPDLFINTIYYKNIGTKGSPAFTATNQDEPLFQSKATEQYTYTSLRWVDINNDGAVDVFHGNSNGSFVYQTASTNIEAVAATAPSVHVFPNPSKEEFIVTIPAASVKSIVRVTDLQGKLLTMLVPNTNTAKFGKGLVSGAYIVQVIQNNKTIFSQKVIKE